MNRNPEVDRYIQAQPENRQAALSALREAVAKSLPEGFGEQMQYGMISYVVPLSLYPAGYHTKPGEPLPFIALANQKQYLALYHMGIYGDPDLLVWFERAYAELGIGKLDMGKSCIRFRKPEAIPLALVKELCAKMTPQAYIAMYEAGHLK